VHGLKSLQPARQLILVVRPTGDYKCITRPRARLGSLTEQYATKGIKSCDLVVIVGWNTDQTDVDLHITDPAGEECFYEHRDTKLGGHITQDVTQGYGPEMFTLTKAAAGKYQVRVHYFAQDANRASTRTKVYATIYEGAWTTC
jgi:uncharacterized protein YfaP (DUF2135 family)